MVRAVIIYSIMILYQYYSSFCQALFRYTTHLRHISIFKDCYRRLDFRYVTIGIIIICWQQKNMRDQLNIIKIRKYLKSQRIFHIVIGKIQNTINEYPDSKFILKNGELEDYLEITKGLDKIIDFCQCKFDSLYKENKSKEILEIFNTILQ